MPTTGQIAYGHMNHFGMLTPGNNNFRTFTRGTWAPNIRPYFGQRTVSTDLGFNPCLEEIEDPDDPTSIEVTYFNGYTRNNVVELV